MRSSTSQPEMGPSTSQPHCNSSRTAMQSVRLVKTLPLSPNGGNRNPKPARDLLISKVTGGEIEDLRLPYCDADIAIGCSTPRDSLNHTPTGKRNRTSKIESNSCWSRFVPR
jgi:hypothetical protein